MGRGGQDKKNHWAGGGGLPGKKITSGVGYILYILKSRRSGAKTLP